MGHRSLVGMPPRRFLRDYWQKKPLLVRQALRGFEGLISPAALFGLAGREDVEARLVTQVRGAWQVRHGPFRAGIFRRLAKRHWTLLVQDLNNFLPEATALLQRCDFIPHARVDDVMVSYAAPGGGVGPHFDSYDVFLLQGQGRRRWQISAQQDRTLVAGAALKMLECFEPEEEWVLDPGDMLYLPPGYAHHGVALTPCMTYSIGFRAPSAQELAEAFLVHLQDTLSLPGFYTDPDLNATRHPAEIPAEMVRQATTTLRRISWNGGVVADFLGAYLSEPKRHVTFAPPARPLSFIRFSAQLEKSGIRLALKSRMLYRRAAIYLNGERHISRKSSRAALRELADRRHLANCARLDEKTALQLYDWYRAGYVEVPRQTRATRKGVSDERP